MIKEMNCYGRVAIELHPCYDMVIIGQVAILGTVELWQDRITGRQRVHVLYFGDTLLLSNSCIHIGGENGV